MDKGSLYQIRNQLNRTNVPSDVKKDFNSCEDFIDIVTSSHMVAAALSTFRMKTVSETPDSSVVAPDLWIQPKKERKEAMDKLCAKVYDRYISLSFNSVSKDYAHAQCDAVSSYAIQLLRMGALYLEFAVAIREGDGERVFRCWRYFLPIFRASQSTNYSCEALLFIHQCLYSLSPRLSIQLVWNRFINVRGLPGRNIPLDLHMEHLNRLIKDTLRTLRANKATRSIMRASQAMGTIAPVLEQFDEENAVQSISCSSRKPTAEHDINIIVTELMQSEAFLVKAGRKLKHFKKPRDLLSVPKEELLDWMVDRLS